MTVDYAVESWGPLSLAPDGCKHFISQLRAIPSFVIAVKLGSMVQGKRRNIRKSEHFARRSLKLTNICVKVDGKTEKGKNTRIGSQTSLTNEILTKQ